MGKLLATFRKSADGKLRTFTIGKYKHYKIRIFVEGLPDGVQTVTYLMHPSFKSDRILTIPYGVPDFQENIMSYGDFFITVTAEGEQPRTDEWFAEAFATRLSDALKAGHPPNQRSAEIEEAIARIASL